MGQTLSSPRTEKQHCLQESDKRLKFAASSMQGWRITMEDAHTAILNVNAGKPNEAELPHVSFFAVFDGHGGTAVAQYAGEHLHGKVTETEEFKNGAYTEAMRRGFLNLDAEIAQGELI
jgi:protein phosphatase 2C family protein 2/3